jgi:hypothetical protein
MKLLYSVLDKEDHEWKKRFSSILMREALVDPLDKIFGQAQYIEDVNVQGYVAKRGNGFFSDKPGLYNAHLMSERNARPRDERLVMITFDDFLGRVEVPMTREEFKKNGNAPINVMVKIPRISIKNMVFNCKHVHSENIKITENPEEKPELIVYSGGSIVRETNTSVVSFAHPTPLNVLNLYPLPFAFIGHYSFTITHELADSLLEDCEDGGKCVKKGVGRYFGERCKKKLESYICS